MKQNGKRLKIILIVTALAAAGIVYFIFSKRINTVSDSNVFSFQLEGDIVETENTMDTENTMEAEAKNGQTNESGSSSGTEETDFDSAGEDISDGAVVNDTITVYVCGAVNVPGVYSLEKDTRVIDAVNRAGGLSSKNGAELINLAEKITDGQRIYIPSSSELDGLSEADVIQGQSAIESKDSTDNVKININTADEAELTKLQGIGSARAQSIIAYRDEHGPFEEPEDIMEVSGIKEAAYDKIKDDICTD